ncbi:hypothetical protein [Agrobacterium cavarae]|uniref:hypothetical protein n=1 Tax=Agrobacterium cavarae TaxID=2528239 RepID=UPI00289F304D|nr:hypothetical protein [Agrobacterium cavarae]
MVNKTMAVLLLGASLAFASSASATMTQDRDEFENSDTAYEYGYSTTSQFGNEFTSDVKSVSLDNVNMTSSVPLTIYQVATSWGKSPWIEDYVGQVLSSNFSQSITLTFDKVVTGFSFLGMANNEGNTLTFSAGGEKLTLNSNSTDNPGGGDYFAWFGKGISSLTISTTDNDGFAIGKVSVVTNGQAVTPVPGPEAGAGLGALALGSMALYMKRRRKEDAAVA